MTVFGTIFSDTQVKQGVYDSDWDLLTEKETGIVYGDAGSIYSVFPIMDGYLVCSNSTTFMHFSDTDWSDNCKELESAMYAKGFNDAAKIMGRVTKVNDYCILLSKECLVVYEAIINLIREGFSSCKPNGDTINFRLLDYCHIASLTPESAIVIS